MHSSRRGSRIVNTDPASQATPEPEPQQDADDRSPEEAGRAEYEEWRRHIPPHEPTREWRDLGDLQQSWIDRAIRKSGTGTASDEIATSRRRRRRTRKPAESSSLRENEKAANNTITEAMSQTAESPPSTESELDAIQERVSELARVTTTITSLGVEGIEAAPVQVAGLHEIASRTERLARQIGFTAVAEGKMSQVQLSRLLGISQATVSRLISEAQQEEQQAP